jgi:hypothetical protein
MNYKENIWKYLLFVVLISCYSKEKAPVLEYEEKQIVDILSDLHIAQAVVKKFPLNQRDSVNKVYKSQIAEVHQIKEAELDSLISTLESYPDYFYEINGMVLENIQKLEEEALESEIEDDSRR